MTPMERFTSSTLPAGELAMETDSWTMAKLSDRMFQRFSAFITAELGIKMPPMKRTMLQGRLQKRLRKLGMTSFEDYADYVFSPEGKADELVKMLDGVTTNKTDFFREPRHFEYLTGTAIPELMRTAGVKIRKKLSVWSAGCSTGAEPYTLAMVLNEFGNSTNRFNFSILATDISTRVLEKAQRAVYREEETAPVPLELRRRYLLRSRDRSSRLVRIVPALRTRVEFRMLNLMDQDLRIQQPLDIIFCRNVIIYFDHPTQKAVLNRLCRYLKPAGFLFMGHSETLHGYGLPLVQTATTIYRKEDR